MQNRCVNCGGEKFTELFLNTDHISLESFPVERCEACGLARTGNVPVDLSKYYTKQYYGGDGKRFNPVVEKLISLFRRARFNFISKQKKEPGSVLDIGCGRGLMLAHLKQLGWKTVGIEYSETLANAAKESSGLDVRVAQNIKECAFEDKSFDIVTLFHVLEHVPDPKVTLQEIYRTLKSDGICIIEVPAIDSWQAVLTKGYWFHIDAPRHLYHFSHKVLEKCLTDIGFEVKVLSSNSLEFGYFGMLQSVLNLFCKKMNVLYDRLKNKSALSNSALTLDFCITLALLLPVALITIPLEFVAVLMGKGCVIRIIARK